MLLNDELQDSLNPAEEDVTLENNADDFSYEEPVVTDEDSEKVKLAEQNRRLYARLKKLEAKKAETPKEEPKAEQPKPTVDPETFKAELREELRLDAKGYSDEEKEIIFKASKALGITPSEAANDEIVAGKISRMREEQKVKNAIPSPSGKAGTKETNSVDYYIENDEWPDDPEMTEKVIKELARRSQSNIEVRSKN